MYIEMQRLEAEQRRRYKRSLKRKDEVAQLANLQKHQGRTGIYKSLNAAPVKLAKQTDEQEADVPAGKLSSVM